MSNPFVCAWCSTSIIAEPKEQDWCPKCAHNRFVSREACNCLLCEVPIPVIDGPTPTVPEAPPPVWAFDAIERDMPLTRMGQGWWVILEHYKGGIKVDAGSDRPNLREVGGLFKQDEWFGFVLDSVKHFNRIELLALYATLLKLMPDMERSQPVDAK